MSWPTRTVFHDRLFGRLSTRRTHKRVLDLPDDTDPPNLRRLPAPAPRLYSGRWEAYTSRRTSRRPTASAGSSTKAYNGGSGGGPLKRRRSSAVKMRPGNKRRSLPRLACTRTGGFAKGIPAPCSSIVRATERPTLRSGTLLPPAATAASTATVVATVGRCRRSSYLRTWPASMLSFY